MSYQTFHPDTGTTVVPIGRHSENDQTFSVTDNESRLYPFGKPVFLSDLSVQMVFVRKIWAIFTSELLVVGITATLLYYNDNEWHSFLRYDRTLWISFVVSLLLLIALTYKSNDDFQPPWYFVILYTCLNAYIIGGLVASLKLTFVLDTLILMMMAGLSVFAFTYQTAYKFRAKEPLILVLVVIIVISSILHPLVFSLSDLIPAFILALLLSLYFILDTWYLMRQMSKDEYWGASMQLYLDLIVPFRTIHHMCELTAEYGDDD
ncbi:inhibitor of apoptosis-promoting Bax1-domain-containing protein [Glomus cerebriforme]|uniref:Inhibitor of apoptosis-promoting Bax1-domain-containing protein n=1 Tax=Glomus cerebriforme TaxID=658196 RepID=A0A397SBL5_9GLOM|nr:inhibitor of apoptosis-promoting Bax1-domain-containing protein [Glomus cerebriforme]